MGGVQVTILVVPVVGTTRPTQPGTSTVPCLKVTAPTLTVFGVIVAVSVGRFGYTTELELLVTEVVVAVAAEIVTLTLGFVPALKLISPL
jgi:hypothetical protein